MLAKTFLYYRRSDLSYGYIRQELQAEELEETSRQ